MSCLECIVLAAHNFLFWQKFLLNLEEVLSELAHPFGEKYLQMNRGEEGLGLAGKGE